MSILVWKIIYYKWCPFVKLRVFARVPVSCRCKVSNDTRIRITLFTTDVVFFCLFHQFKSSCFNNEHRSLGSFRCSSALRIFLTAWSDSFVLVAVFLSAIFSCVEIMTTPFSLKRHHKWTHKRIKPITPDILTWLFPFLDLIACSLYLCSFKSMVLLCWTHRRRRRHQPG